MTTVDLLSPVAAPAPRVKAATATRPKRRSRVAYNATMKVLRRAHLYSGLFLTPWVLLYGVTGMLFNHPDWFSGRQFTAIGPTDLAGSPLADIPKPGDLAARVVQAVNAAEAAKQMEAANQRGQGSAAGGMSASTAPAGPAEFRVLNVDQARYAQGLTATFQSGGKPFNFRLDLGTGDGSIREGVVRNNRGGTPATGPAANGPAATTGGLGATTGASDDVVLDAAGGESADVPRAGERRAGRSEAAGERSAGERSAGERLDATTRPATQPTTGGRRGTRTAGDARRGGRGAEAGRGDRAESGAADVRRWTAKLDLPAFATAPAAVLPLLNKHQPSVESLDVRFTPELTFDMEGLGKSWRARYDPLTGAVTATPAQPTAERPAPETRRFLLSLHTAHGYPATMNARWAWAVIVDVMFVAMCGWALTGLLMWWQLKNTRLIGAVVLVASGVTATLMVLSMHANMTGG